MTRSDQKAITFKITTKEYEKIKQIAKSCHMSPTEFSRHQALGNQITPTVLEVTDSENHVSSHQFNLLEKAYVKQKAKNLKITKDYQKAIENIHKDYEKVSIVNQLIPYIQIDGTIDNEALKNDKDLLTALSQLDY
ncbi:MULTISPECIES: plasmid mobilization protein [Mammaliicoccus]|jgi:hypothetical protein|nr:MULTISPECIES: hypothetical protein [Mammaliicoccus]KTT82331.1 hypothetical protein NS202_09370 [Mammaliicoccus sciuri]MBA1395600.1 hypothetical protein [Mammaliicoccus sciuri]MBF0720775.1 hypothetical protein [Mammaliicoccus sciuri]MBF0772850.1 hypothetical protein [Mammaliicoccus sciuri]MBG9209478.1 hypothetical protein [Mammaliicoccus sciuri]